MYQIESASSHIKRELHRIPRPDRVRIVEAVQAMADDLRPSGVAQLGQDVYRMRVGDHRVIYKVLDEERVILIGRIVRHSPLLRHRRLCSCQGVRKAHTETYCGCWNRVPGGKTCATHLLPNFRLTDLFGRKRVDLAGDPGHESADWRQFQPGR
jgi:mRNA interferase RelE/StbE